MQKEIERMPIASILNMLHDARNKKKQVQIVYDNKDWIFEGHIKPSKAHPFKCFMIRDKRAENHPHGQHNVLTKACMEGWYTLHVSSIISIQLLG